MYQPKFSYQIITENVYSQQIDEIIEQISIHSVAGTLTSFDGLTLAYEFIPVEHAIGNVVIVHGFTEFYRKYYETTWYFMNMGYNVFLYDQRGHGHSGREADSLSLAHVNSFTDYVGDLCVIMQKLVASVAPDLPNIAFAHSMGGSVVLMTMQQYPQLFARAILSSPMIAPYTHHVPLGIVYRNAVKDVQNLGPLSRFRYASDYDPNPPYERSFDRSRARFAHNVQLRNSDEYYQNSVATNSWIREASSLKSLLLDRSRNAKIEAPVLVFKGGKDKVVRTDYLALLVRRLPQGVLKYYPQAYHSLYSGSDEQLVHYYDDIFTFLKA